MDNWKTFPFEFRGGLISNLAPLQQGTQAPGSARILKNFEPSIDGGYRRILGYSKYDNSAVPVYGTPYVHGAANTGTTLVINNLSAAPVDGSSFTIAGVTGTYTIAAAGVSYNTVNRRATLTLTTSLASTPADKAAITFANNTSLIVGLAAWQGVSIVYRNGSIYKSDGGGWSRINVPVYGNVQVVGGSQTGSTLAVDGLTGIPQIGDTFTIAGVALVYTVTSIPSVVATAATLVISPALDSSPADNAALTFLSIPFSASTKARFTKYRIGSSEKIAGVNGADYPFVYDGSTFKKLAQASSDVIGASHIAWFKNQLVFAKGDTIIITSPFTDDDFLPANGSAIINVGSAIVGLEVFREQLIIFSEKRINRLVGNTTADFQLQPITTDLGCVAEDTIKEVGGDIMFLGPDGLRLLSATDKIGDFNLGSVSKNIQAELTALINSSESFSSVVIRGKSQYRLFGYTASFTSAASSCVLGTQMLSAEGSAYNWSEIVGIKSYVSDSDYKGKTETIIFSHSDGFVYKMESGSSFDGANIHAVFATPYVPVTDPRIRKTIYRVDLYTAPVGGVDITFNMKFDFDDSDTIQPDSINLSNITNSTVLFGSASAVYGVARYGAKLKKIFGSQVIGSGFFVSLQISTDDVNAPFILDTATIDFATHDRR